MKCSIIIVNYKSEAYLEKCLYSIGEQFQKDDFAFEVLVVNNDNKKLLLKNTYKFNLKIIENGQNIGFGKANNIGASQANGDHFFFLNPDTVLIDDSLVNTVDNLEKHQGVGIIGSRIIKYSQNRPQPWTCGNKSSITNIIFRNTINKPWRKKVPTNVDWVSGAALLIRKELFEKLGGFDENFFMYFEDQDLCLRAKAHGNSIIFFPHMSVVHFDGKSWRNNSQKKHFFYKSQIYFFDKHHGSIKTNFLKILRFIIKGV